jgi:large subunit ribosomal protein L25
MANEVTLTVENRIHETKGTLKDKRKQGLIPAIVYGSEEKNIPVWIKEKEFDKIIHTEQGANVLINLKIGDQTKMVLVKDIQRHVVSIKIIHVDFHIISLKKKIEIEVPIHIHGEAPGVKVGGGVLQHILRNMHVRCLPTEIPQKIELDVSNLNINEGILVKDIKIDGNYEILNDPDSTVLNVVPPTKLEEPEPDAAAAVVEGAVPTEPEVISKGKKEEEDEEGKEPAAKETKDAGKEKSKEKK